MSILLDLESGKKPVVGSDNDDEKTPARDSNRTSTTKPSYGNEIV